MAVGRLYDKLKRRWGITSSVQVGLILTVFAVTGSTTMYLYRYLRQWLGIDGAPLVFRIVAFVLVTLPLYNVLLVFWGTVLGQGRFFRQFVWRFLARLLRRANSRPKDGPSE